MMSLSKNSLSSGLTKGLVDPGFQFDYACLIIYHKYFVYSSCSFEAEAEASFSAAKLGYYTTHNQLRSFPKQQSGNTV